MLTLRFSKRCRRARSPCAERCARPSILAAADPRIWAGGARSACRRRDRLDDLSAARDTQSQQLRTTQRNNRAPPRRYTLTRAYYAAPSRTWSHRRGERHHVARRVGHANGGVDEALDPLFRSSSWRRTLPFAIFLLIAAAAAAASTAAVVVVAMAIVLVIVVILRRGSFEGLCKGYSCVS